MNDDRWHRHPHALWRLTLESVMIMPEKGSEPLVLAGTGTELWALLEEQLTTSTIVEVLAARHNAERAVVEGDIVPLLERLSAIGAVERVRKE